MGLFCRAPGCGKGSQIFAPFSGQEAWGHVVRKLIEELPETIAIQELLTDKAMVLDAFYIPTRYAKAALGAWPRGMQIGGGVNIDNAATWLDHGASASLTPIWSCSSKVA
jgi:hypothetical protein